MRTVNERVSELVLVALPTAITCARLLVQAAAGHAQLEQHMASNLADVVDELVTHAVATTGITEPRPIYQYAASDLAVLVVRLRLSARAVVAEVWDSGTDAPEAFAATSVSIDDWGYDLLRPGLRVVWCLLRLPVSAAATTQMPRVLSRRIPMQGAMRPAEAMQDAHLLQRVLDGLNTLNWPEEAP
jgi:anti-sigma regulatory factor (Ser/Thr protein kinase)